MKEIDPNLPIDKTAALVVSRDNSCKAEFNRMHTVSSLVPLPVVQFTGPVSFDLTNTKVGRLTIIGISAHIPKKRQGTNTGSRWVVRCACGRYEVFSGKALRKQTV